jgi:MFS family permease
MIPNLKKSQQRAIQYWFMDGLAELSGGLICLLLAIIFFIQHRLPVTPLSYKALFLIPFIIAFGIRWIMQRVKEHSTYLRTGKVTPKSGWENQGAMAIAISFTVLLLGLMFFQILQAPKSIDWMPGIGGLIFAFIFAWTGYQTALLRLYFLSLFCLLTGVGLAIVGLGGLLGATLLCILTSLILFVFGSVTRWTYLHQNPLLPEENDGH